MLDKAKSGGKIRLALLVVALSKYYVENGNINDVRGCMFGGQKMNTIIIILDIF